MFEKAIEYNIIEKNPVTKRPWFRRDRTAEDSREWWTPDEEAKAMALLFGPWRERDLQAAVTLTTQILLGLRFSEVRALEKKDLDLQVPGIWIRRSQARKVVSTPKNKRARFHVIPRVLADELQKFMLRTEDQLLFPDPRGGVLANKVLNRWYRDLAQEAGVRHITSHGARHTAGSIVGRLKEHRHLRGELVFCRNDGRMLSKAECKRPLWRACKRAGLRRIGWHVLRHTFASHLVMRGASLRVVQELLGHASIEMTMRYAHITVDAKRAAVELLDQRHPDGTMEPNAV
jgi:integrase